MRTLEQIRNVFLLAHRIEATASSEQEAKDITEEVRELLRIAEKYYDLFDKLEIWSPVLGSPLFRDEETP